MATRFHCTVHRVFKKLVTIIESDIKRFNELAEKKTYGTIKADEQNVIIGRVSECPNTHNGRVACVSTDGRTIPVSKRIDGADLPGFTINPDWNDREMDWDLYIGEEKVSVYRASQKIIGDMLFS